MYFLFRDELVENIRVGAGTLDDLRHQLIKNSGIEAPSHGPATVDEIIDLATKAWGTSPAEVALVKA